MKIWEQFLNCILPPRCLKCGCILSDNRGLCPRCIQEINFITAPYCQKCGHPLETLPENGGKMLCGSCLSKKRTPFRLSRSAFRYDENSKHLVLAFKFHDKTDNASLLAKMMFVAGRDIFDAGADVIIPVPLHYTRLIKRRYNQSALLGHELSRLCGLPADCRSLVKHRRTRPQVELRGRERLENVKGAFSVKRAEKIKGKRVVLIDDVLTTGTTLKECAYALKRAGAKSVDTLTVARVV